MYCESCKKLVGEIELAEHSRKCPLCGKKDSAVNMPQLVVFRAGLSSRPIQFDFRDGNEYPVTEEYEKAFALVDSQGREVFISKWMINNYFQKKEA